MIMELCVYKEDAVSDFEQTTKNESKYILRRMRINQLRKLIEIDAAPASIKKQIELIFQTF